MKQIRLTKILAASLVFAASLGLALAQTTTTTTSTDPVTGTTTTQQTTTSSCGKHRHLHPGLGLFYVPNGVGCGARALLLHEGYDSG